MSNLREFRECIDRSWNSGVVRIFREWKAHSPSMIQHMVGLVLDFGYSSVVSAIVDELPVGGITEWQIIRYISDRYVNNELFDKMCKCLPAMEPDSAREFYTKCAEACKRDHQLRAHCYRQRAQVAHDFSPVSSPVSSTDHSPAPPTDHTPSICTQCEELEHEVVLLRKKLARWESKMAEAAAANDD